MGFAVPPFKVTEAFRSATSALAITQESRCPLYSEERIGSHVTAVPMPQG
jgi:hypothetical protein